MSPAFAPVGGLSGLTLCPWVKNTVRPDHSIEKSPMMGKLDIISSTSLSQLPLMTVTKLIASLSSFATRIGAYPSGRGLRGPWLYVSPSRTTFVSGWSGRVASTMEKNFSRLTAEPWMSDATKILISYLLSKSVSSVVVAAVVVVAAPVFGVVTPFVVAVAAVVSVAVGVVAAFAVVVNAAAVVAPHRASSVIAAVLVGRGLEEQEDYEQSRHGYAYDEHYTQRRGRSACRKVAVVVFGSFGREKRFAFGRRHGMPRDGEGVEGAFSRRAEERFARAVVGGKRQSARAVGSRVAGPAEEFEHVASGIGRGHRDSIRELYFGAVGESESHVGESVCRRRSRGQGCEKRVFGYRSLDVTARTERGVEDVNIGAVFHGFVIIALREIKGRAVRVHFYVGRLGGFVRGEHAVGR
nr:MAG TPA: hypothetical protein [Caudoviricetes sp.]